MTLNNHKNVGEYFVFFILMIAFVGLLSGCTIPDLSDDMQIIDTDEYPNDLEETDEPKLDDPNAKEPIKSEPAASELKDPTPTPDEPKIDNPDDSVDVFEGIPVIVGVSASDFEVTSSMMNSPDKTIDKNYADESRWSAEGFQWIMYEFEKVTKINEMSILFLDSARRVYDFSLEYSLDNVSWNKIGDFKSSSLDWFETFSFNPVDAKYFKYTGRFNNENNWNSLVEVTFDEIPIKEVQSPQPPVVSDPVKTPVKSDPVKPGTPNLKTVPYKIPDVRTENDFKNKVYFDPTYKGGNSDGTISRPYTDFNKQYINGIPPNTAFLFKRGTTHPKIGREVGGRNSFYPKMLYYNNFIGPYGEGEKPVIEGFFIMAGSHHLTIRDLSIKAESQAGGYDAVVYIHRTKNGEYIFCSNITIAHSEIAGVYNPNNYYNPSPYPFFGIRFFSDDFTIYNSIIRDTWQHGIIVERGSNFKAVRNWIYDVVHQDQRALDEGWPTKNSEDPWSYEHRSSTSKAGWGNSVFVATYVDTTNHYIAGNLMDRSRYRWKAAYITGAGWDSTHSNMIFEYNTFIAPKASSAGGVAVNWGAPKGSIFRNNVIDCSNQGKGATQFAMAGRSPRGSLRDHLSQSYPYGIYDNHMIRPYAGFSLTGIDNEMSKKNKLFNSWSEYQTFLKTNDPVGSDIDPNDFWQEK